MNDSDRYSRRNFIVKSVPVITAGALSTPHLIAQNTQSSTSSLGNMVTYETTTSSGETALLQVRFKGFNRELTIESATWEVSSMHQSQKVERMSVQYEALKLTDIHFGESKDPVYFGNVDQWGIRNTKDAELDYITPAKLYPPEPIYLQLMKYDGSGLYRTVIAYSLTEVSPSRLYDGLKMIYKDHYTWNNSSDEECYLTTACSHFRNLPDNCKELETLRAFRDSHLRSAAGGQALIDEYYAIAPAIVQQIEHHPNKAALYDWVYANVVSKTLAEIRSGQHQRAIEQYRNATYILRDALSKPVAS